LKAWISFARCQRIFETKEMRNRDSFPARIDHMIENCLVAINVSAIIVTFKISTWFITAIPGEIYIKQSWGKKPFINKNILNYGPD
jgi:hypothetical protein